MEQARGARDLEQVEAWVEAAVAWAGEVVLRQVQVDTASAPTVVKGRPINWGAPVMGSDVLSAELR